MRDGREAVRRDARRRLALLALVVTGLTAGCTGSASVDTPTAPASPTPLAQVDLTGVVPERAAFCDALDPDAVAEVLGGAPAATSGYRSGQRAELTTGLRDVAGEYSCSFARGPEAQPRTARAWLFAQAVTPGRARGWIEERRADDSCREAGDLVFGNPGLVQSCSTEERRRVTAVGLFGDGFLTCQVTAPRRDALPEEGLLESAQRWCAEVARSTAS